jgi:hypothetical protein
VLFSTAAPTPGLADFGDFQAGPNTAAPRGPAPVPAPAPAKPVDSWGGLVDLGKLEINDPKEASGPTGGGAVGHHHPSANPNEQFQFADLDAFAKVRP